MENMPPAANGEKEEAKSAFAEALADGFAGFKAEFDPNSATYHGGDKTAVPLGGGRLPAALAGENPDWMSLPIAPLTIEDSYGPEHEKLVAAREKLGQIKKSLSVLSPPIEAIMRLQKEMEKLEEGDEEGKTSLQSRLNGEATKRAGIMESVVLARDAIENPKFHREVKPVVNEILDRATKPFGDKSSFGEFCVKIQRCTQVVFRLQGELLQDIKKIKKERAKRDAEQDED